MHPIAYLRSRLRRARMPTPAQTAAPPARVRPRDELHAFWRDPDSVNRPERYLEPTARSRFLIELVRPLVGADARILELGCNVGRNLAHLYDAGYRHLTGIEINADALTVLRESYPDLGATAELINAPIEDVIRDIPDGSFDVVFAMAVLEHLHPDSEWVFDEIARIARSFVVTIEDEEGVSRHHVPRDYRIVFESRGMHQLAEQGLSSAEGFPTAFQARTFATGSSEAADRR